MGKSRVSNRIGCCLPLCYNALDQMIHRVAIQAFKVFTFEQGGFHLFVLDKALECPPEHDGESFGVNRDKVSCLDACLDDPSHKRDDFAPVSVNLDF